MESTSKNKKLKPQKKQSVNWKWVITITILSFFISFTMSYVSSQSLASVGNIVAFIILFIFIFVGIIFDMIGMSATSATEKEFHSMAAKKVKGATQAVWLSRNAEKVSSFCNDVVGDICGIISGSTGAIIIARVIGDMTAIQGTVFSLSITGIIASMTIGGKAIAKGIAMKHSVSIVFVAGKILSILPVNIGKKK